MPEVTQADRDAVYAWQTSSDHAPNKLAEAFARHREATFREGLRAGEESMRDRATVAAFERAVGGGKPRDIFDAVRALHVTGERGWPYRA